MSEEESPPILTLSVILPNYNHGSVLGRALEALATQSRTPDELLVLDDGSTDNSLDVIEACSRRHPFIRVLRSDRNQGAAVAARRLFGEAIGSYVYAAGADDTVLPGFFESAMDLASRHPAAGVICGRVVAVDDSGRDVYRFDVPSWKEPCFITPERFAREYLSEMPAGHSLSAATIYRRRAYDELGGLQPDLGPWSDTFLIRAISLRYGCCFVPHDCAAFTSAPASFSGSFVRDLEAVDRMVNRAVELMNSTPYSALFPHGHPEQWSRAYRRAVAEQCLWQVQTELLAQRASVARRLRRWGAWTRPMAWILDRLLGLRARRAHGRLTRRIAGLGWPVV